MRLRKDVVFERLLARLLVAAPDRWVLKGGLALDYRLGDRARTTKDMDLGRQDDAAAATADLMAAAALDLGDYIRYAIEQTEAVARMEEGAAVRYRVRTELAGRVFEHVVVDVGFDAPRLYPVERVRGHGLLAFADLESPEVPTIPLAYHIAEKAHAYTRHYGAGGRESTRVKDLVDLVLIATERTPQLVAGAVRVALDQTFAQRNTHPLPAALPAPPTGVGGPLSQDRGGGGACERHRGGPDARRRLPRPDPRWDVRGRRYLAAAHRNLDSNRPDSVDHPSAPRLADAPYPHPIPNPRG